MKMRKRSSRFPVVNWRERIDSSEPLKGQLWTRSEKALKEPDADAAARSWKAHADAGPDQAQQTSRKETCSSQRLGATRKC